MKIQPGTKSKHSSTTKGPKDQSYTTYRSIRTRYKDYNFNTNLLKLNQEQQNPLNQLTKIHQKIKIYKKNPKSRSKKQRLTAVINEGRHDCRLVTMHDNPEISKANESKTKSVEIRATKAQSIWGSTLASREKMEVEEEERIQIEWGKVWGNTGYIYMPLGEGYTQKGEIWRCRSHLLSLSPLIHLLLLHALYLPQYQSPLALTTAPQPNTAKPETAISLFFLFFFKLFKTSLFFSISSLYKLIFKKNKK